MQIEATKQRGNEALNKGDHEYARWCYNLALRLAHSAASQVSRESDEGARRIVVYLRRLKRSGKDSQNLGVKLIVPSQVTRIQPFSDIVYRRVQV